MITMVDNSRLFNVTKTKNNLSQILNTIDFEPAYIMKQDQIKAIIVSPKEIKRQEDTIANLEDEILSLKAALRIQKIENGEAKFIPAHEIIGDIENNPYKDLTDEELFE